MTDRTASERVRRPALARAFQHLAELGEAVDLAGLDDPGQMWLRSIRTTVPRYGDVGPAVDLAGVSHAPVSAGGVAAEWVRAEGADPNRRIVYIHGGGWAAGSPLDYRAFSATLARLSGASLLMVDYRLAPEHRFPAGLDDCVTALEWAFDHGPPADGSRPRQGSPDIRVGLAGDSAGGNLAAATCLRQAAKGGRMPDRLALIAGTLDNVSVAERVGLDDPICTRDTLSIPVGLYLGPDGKASDPLVSPVLAAADLVRAFPPTLLQVSAIESLRHDSRRFADRLEGASVRVTLSLWPELPHVWHAFLGLFPEAEEALAEVADFLRR